MSINVCADFNLLPVPSTNADIADINQLREFLESMHQANLALLQEVATLRREVNALKGV